MVEAVAEMTQGIGWTPQDPTNNMHRGLVSCTRAETGSVVVSVDALAMEMTASFRSLSSRTPAGDRLER